MIRGLALVLACWPVATLAEGGPSAATAAELDALTTAIVAVGCRVTEANSAAVLAASGLSDIRAGEVVSQLAAEGRAMQVANGDMLLDDPACPPRK